MIGKQKSMNRENKMWKKKLWILQENAKDFTKSKEKKYLFMYMDDIKIYQERG